jgi:hypothetical protein
MVESSQIYQKIFYKLVYITSEPKGRKEYLPRFAVAAVNGGEQSGLYSKL